MTGKFHKSYGKNALKALAGFLGTMAFLTVLSRSAASILTPYVGVQSPESGSLTYKISASGTVEENQVQAVLTVPGIRVKRVFIKEGDQVKKGEKLFQLDMADLKEKIFLKKGELEKLDLGISDFKDKEAVEQTDKSLEQQRAGEDYNRTTWDSNAQVQRAYEAMLAAGKRLNDFDSQGSSPLGEELFSSGDPVEQAQGEISLFSDGEADAALSQYQSEQETLDTKDIQERRSGLEEAYIQAKNAYEDAVRQREESLSAAGRKVEDAGKPEAQDSTLKTMELDREVLTMELDKYLSLEKKKGIVRAPGTGVIRKLGVEVGYAAPDASAVTMADLSAGTRLAAAISADEAARISLGDEITVKPSDGSKKIEGLTIDSIKMNPENRELVDIGVKITDNQLKLGTSAVIEVEKKSVPYATILPLQALHLDGQQYYVLVVQGAQDILGTELRAYRYDVKVKEKSNEMAALESGTLFGTEQVIVSAEKKVESGDSVRLREE